jgi:hypothetical protein
LKYDLAKGKFAPGVPITIEVPKSFRIKVGGPAKRLGPSFSRPGSILRPSDRILYQVLADQAAPAVKAKTDESRSFGHRLADGTSDAMFLPTRKCWGDLQNAIRPHVENEGHRYILRLDVADYFGSINQHTLVNTLMDNGYPSELVKSFEAVLLKYTDQRSSRGILQGMYPSDLFGSFYMHPIDRFFDDLDIASARYSYCVKNCKKINIINGLWERIVRKKPP